MNQSQEVKFPRVSSRRQNSEHDKLPPKTQPISKQGKPLVTFSPKKIQSSLSNSRLQVSDISQTNSQYMEAEQPTDEQILDRQNSAQSYLQKEIKQLTKTLIFAPEGLPGQQNFIFQVAQHINVIKNMVSLYNETDLPVISYTSLRGAYVAPNAIQQLHISQQARALAIIAQHICYDFAQIPVVQKIKIFLNYFSDCYNNYGSVVVFAMQYHVVTSLQLFNEQKKIDYNLYINLISIYQQLGYEQCFAHQQPGSTLLPYEHDGSRTANDFPNFKAPNAEEQKKLSDFLERDFMDNKKNFYYNMSILPVHTQVLDIFEVSNQDPTVFLKALCVRFNLDYGQVSALKPVVGLVVTQQVYKSAMEMEQPVQLSESIMRHHDNIVNPNRRIAPVMTLLQKKRAAKDELLIQELEQKFDQSFREKIKQGRGAKDYERIKQADADDIMLGKSMDMQDIKRLRQNYTSQNEDINYLSQPETHDIGDAELQRAKYNHVFGIMPDTTLQFIESYATKKHISIYKSLDLYLSSRNQTVTEYMRMLELQKQQKPDEVKDVAFEQLVQYVDSAEFFNIIHGSESLLQKQQTIEEYRSIKSKELKSMTYNFNFPKIQGLGDIQTLYYKQHMIGSFILIPGAINLQLKNVTKSMFNSFTDLQKDVLNDTIQFTFGEYITTADPYTKQNINQPIFVPLKCYICQVKDLQRRMGDHKYYFDIGKDYNREVLKNTRLLLNSFMLFVMSRCVLDTTNGVATSKLGDLNQEQIYYKVTRFLYDQYKIHIDLEANSGVRTYFDYLYLDLGSLAIVKESNMKFFDKDPIVAYADLQLLITKSGCTSVNIMPTEFISMLVGDRILASIAIRDDHLPIPTLMNSFGMFIFVSLGVTERGIERDKDRQVKWDFPEQLETNFNIFQFKALKGLTNLTFLHEFAYRKALISKSLEETKRKEQVIRRYLKKTTNTYDKITELQKIYHKILK